MSTEPQPRLAERADLPHSAPVYVVLICHTRALLEPCSLKVSTFLLGSKVFQPNIPFTVYGLWGLRLSTTTFLQGLRLSTPALLLASRVWRPSIPFWELRLRSGTREGTVRGIIPAATPPLLPYQDKPQLVAVRCTQYWQGQYV